MRPAALFAVLAVLLATALCLRLGFWQLSRLAEKRSLNAGRRAAFEAPVVPWGAAVVPPESLLHRRVEVRGRYDLGRHVLLAGRARAGVSGVEVVTPLLLAGDSAAVLVDRGWLAADDAERARPQDHDEPGEVTVTGVAEGMPPAGRMGALYALEQDSLTLWSALVLDRDTLAARLPYALAPFLLRQLPAPGVPAKPARAGPQPLPEAKHLSYAVQWFACGAIVLLGSLALARGRRRAAPTGGGDRT